MQGRYHVCRIALATLVGAFVFGCGGDSSGPDEDPLDKFSPELKTSFCVRGVLDVGEDVGGSIDTGDCASDEPGDEGYFELWYVPVSSTRTVTFDASSSFDNYLELIRVNSFTNTTANVTLLASADDRTPEDTDALLAFELTGGQDYFIVVSGFDFSQIGQYTLTAR
jgi:hypothetical protein